MKQKTKSPLKAKPLRYSGQSLDEEIDTLVYEKALFYVMMSFVMVFLAGFEWYKFYSNRPPTPMAATIFALLVVLFSFIRVRKIFKRLKSVRLGRDGERIVGQFLENLREKGYRIFHDLVGEKFNLDHVIISKKGIYVIETKTYSKPVKGETKIGFDGKRLFFQGKAPMTQPLVQVIAAATWLKNILKETTGKDFPIKPVVLFPGWFVESTSEGKKSDIWVLNPKALPSFIEKQPDIILQEDMILAAFHISRYIRTKEACN